MEININKIPILVIKFMKSNEIEVQMGIKEEAQCKRNHNLTQSLNLTVTQIPERSDTSEMQKNEVKGSVSLR